MGLDWKEGKMRSYWDERLGERQKVQKRILDSNLASSDSSSHSGYGEERWAIGGVPRTNLFLLRL
jgi:hypothetical protein